MRQSLKSICNFLFFARSKARGYTLIELAIAVMVGGILIGAAASSTGVYLKNQASQTTLNNISIVTASLSNYLIQTGAYPCPAPIDAARTDPRYGIAGDCTDTSVVDGSCGNGYCVQQSDKVWNATPPVGWPASKAWPPTGWSDRARRGAVPFRTLGIREDEAEDGFNTRLDYTVMESLAVVTTYNQKNGGIDVYNNHGTTNGHPGTPIVNSPRGSQGGSMQYIVISHGPDRAGAYSHDGLLVNPCPPLYSTWDAANCQTGSSLTPAIYYLADYAEALGINHFDDTVKYYSSVETPLWKVAGSTSTNLNDLVGAGDGPSMGKVGIGSAPSYAAPSAALQVTPSPTSTGSAIIAENNLDATLLCPYDGTSTNCYAPALNLTACAPDPITHLPTYATGFASGQLVCRPAKVMCPAGEFLAGIDPTGNLICQTVIGCPAKSPIQMCFNTSTGSNDIDTIPAGYLDQVYTPPVDGDSFTKTYQCKSSGAGSANWVKTGQAGVCTCTAGTSPATEACNVYKGDNCPNCWIGIANFSNTTACPGGATTQTYVSDTCQCNSYTNTWTTSCQSGFTGSNNYSQAYACIPGNPTAVGTWGAQTMTSSCTCTPSTASQNIDCQSAGHPAGFAGSVTQTRQFQCPAGTWTGWTTTTDTCACTGGTNYRQIGCTAPQVGTQYQQQTISCPSGTPGPWTTYNSTCGSVIYTWQAISTGTPTHSPPTIEMGSTCSTQGATSPCGSITGPSQYTLYNSCQCE